MNEPNIIQLIIIKFKQKLNDMLINDKYLEFVVVHSTTYKIIKCSIVGKFIIIKVIQKLEFEFYAEFSNSMSVTSNYLYYNAIYTGVSP
jgi:hypothetical protein